MGGCCSAPGAAAKGAELEGEKQSRSNSVTLETGAQILQDAQSADSVAATAAVVEAPSSGLLAWEAARARRLDENQQARQAAGESEGAGFATGLLTAGPGAAPAPPGGGGGAAAGAEEDGNRALVGRDSSANNDVEAAAAAEAAVEMRASFDEMQGCLEGFMEEKGAGATATPPKPPHKKEGKPLPATAARLPTTLPPPAATEAAPPPAPPVPALVVVPPLADAKKPEAPAEAQVVAPVEVERPQAEAAGREPQAAALHPVEPRFACFTSNNVQVRARVIRRMEPPPDAAAGAGASGVALAAKQAAASSPRAGAAWRRHSQSKAVPLLYLQLRISLVRSAEHLPSGAVKVAAALALAKNGFGICTLSPADRSGTGASSGRGGVVPGAIFKTRLVVAAGAEEAALSVPLAWHAHALTELVGPNTSVANVPQAANLLKLRCLLKLEIAPPAALAANDGAVAITHGGPSPVSPVQASLEVKLGPENGVCLPLVLMSAEEDGLLDKRQFLTLWHQLEHLEGLSTTQAAAAQGTSSSSAAAANLAAHWSVVLSPTADGAHFLGASLASRLRAQVPTPAAEHSQMQAIFDEALMRMQLCHFPIVHCAVRETGAKPAMTAFLCSRLAVGLGRSTRPLVQLELVQADGREPGLELRLCCRCARAGAARGILQAIVTVLALSDNDEGGMGGQIDLAALGGVKVPENPGLCIRAGVTAEADNDTSSRASAMLPHATLLYEQLCKRFVALCIQHVPANSNGLDELSKARAYSATPRYRRTPSGVVEEQAALSEEDERVAQEALAAVACLRPTCRRIGGRMAIASLSEAHFTGWHAQLIAAALAHLAPTPYHFHAVRAQPGSRRSASVSSQPTLSGSKSTPSGSRSSTLMLIPEVVPWFTELVDTLWTHVERTCASVQDCVKPSAATATQGAAAAPSSAHDAPTSGTSGAPARAGAGSGSLRIKRSSMTAVRTRTANSDLLRVAVAACSEVLLKRGGAVAVQSQQTASGRQRTEASVKKVCTALAAIAAAPKESVPVRLKQELFAGPLLQALVFRLRAPPCHEDDGASADADAATAISTVERAAVARVVRVAYAKLAPKRVLIERLVGAALIEVVCENPNVIRHRQPVEAGLQMRPVMPDGVATLLSFCNVILSTWAAAAAFSPGPGVQAMEAAPAARRSMSDFQHRVLMPLHKLPNATLSEFLPELQQCLTTVAQAVPQLGVDAILWLLRRMPQEAKKAVAFLSEVQMLLAALPPHPRATASDGSSDDDEQAPSGGVGGADRQRALWGPCDPAAPLQFVASTPSTPNGLWNMVTKLAQLAGESNAAIAQHALALLLEDPISAVLGEPGADSSLLLKVHSLLPKITGGGHWCEDINQMAAEFNELHAAKLRSLLVPGL